MLARRTNITKDKIVLRYEKSENKLDSAVSIKFEENLLTKPYKVSQFLIKTKI
jgi:hypothetical protein